MTGDWPPCFFLSGNLSTSQRLDLHFSHNSSRNPEMPWSWKYHPHLRLPRSSDSKKSKIPPITFHQTDLASWWGRGSQPKSYIEIHCPKKKHFMSPSLPDHQWCRSLRWWSRCAPPLRSFHANNQHRVAMGQHAIHRNPTNKQKKTNNKMCWKWQAVVNHSWFSVNNHVPKSLLSSFPNTKIGRKCLEANLPDSVTSHRWLKKWLLLGGCSKYPTYPFQNVK